MNGHWNHSHGNRQPEPRTIEDTLYRVEFQIERKTFHLILKDNPRGRFLRIVEDTGHGRQPASIIVPDTGFKEFQKILDEMIRAEEEIPPKQGEVR